MMADTAAADFLLLPMLFDAVSPYAALAAALRCYALS